MSNVCAEIYNSILSILQTNIYFLSKIYLHKQSFLNKIIFHMRLVMYVWYAYSNGTTCTLHVYSHDELEYCHDLYRMIRVIADSRTDHDDGIVVAKTIVSTDQRSP